MAAAKCSHDHRGRIKILDMDTTWLDYLCWSIHDHYTHCTTNVVREHPLDNWIFVSNMPTPSEVRDVAARLEERLNKLQVTVGKDQRAFCTVPLSEGPGSYALANLVRRALMTRIPTLAIDSVRVTNCTIKSVLEEELAHRIGMLKIHTSLQPTQDLASSVVGKIKVSGCDLRADTISFTYRDGAECQVRISAPYRKVRLCTLQPCECLEAELELKCSTPQRTHAKFDTVASPSFYPVLRTRSLPESLWAHGYRLAEDEVIEHPDYPVRLERLEEIMDDAKEKWEWREDEVRVGIESLGEEEPQELLYRATRAIIAEVHRLVAFCDTLPMKT